MKTIGSKCVCGLRIVERVTGWEHLTTVAGREAASDHRATPRANGLGVAAGKGPTGEAGLSSQQSKVLEVLRTDTAHRNGLSARYIAEVVNTSAEGAAATASSLIRRGLAERVRMGRVFYRAVNR